jgi:hypothetical protein
VSPEPLPEKEVASTVPATVWLAVKVLGVTSPGTPRFVRASEAVSPPVPPSRMERTPLAQPLQALVCKELSENLMPPEVFNSPTVSTAAAYTSGSKAVTENNITPQMMSIDTFLFMTVPPFSSYKLHTEILFKSDIIFPGNHDFAAKTPGTF